MTYLQELQYHESQHGLFLLREAERTHPLSLAEELSAGAREERLAEEKETAPPPEPTNDNLH